MLTVTHVEKGAFLTEGDRKDCKSCCCHQIPLTHRVCSCQNEMVEQQTMFQFLIIIAIALNTPNEAKGTIV